jgi:hypothetical protein
LVVAAPDQTTLPVVRAILGIVYRSCQPFLAQYEESFPPLPYSGIRGQVDHGRLREVVNPARATTRARVFPIWHWQSLQAWQAKNKPARASALPVEFHLASLVHLTKF